MDSCTAMPTASLTIRSWHAARSLRNLGHSQRASTRDKRADAQCFHGSDNPDSVRREFALVFEGADLDWLVNQANAPP